MFKPKNDKNDLVFTPYLDETEDILWAGQPNPLDLLSSSDIYMIPFSLLWGGFALFWESKALSFGGSGFMVLWGIPFVIIGQYMIWGRFVHKYFMRRNTHYAITEQRVLIIKRLFRQKFESYFLRDLTGINVKGNHIGFGTRTHPQKSQPTWSGEYGPGFYALPDVGAVYKILQREITYQSKK